MVSMEKSEEDLASSLVHINLPLKLHMMFGQEITTCDGFSDGHDEIVVGVNFGYRRLVCGYYLQGERVLLGTPCRASNFGSLTSSSISAKRKSIV